MTSSKTVASLDELAQEASALAASLARDSAGATLITLSGDLGAGKTAFTQAFAQSLGIKESVTSPTFVLAKNYDLPEGGVFTHLVHIDAYRLTGGRELAALDFVRVMEDAGTIVMLEWPEMVADALPKAHVALKLEVNPDQSRTLTYA